MNEYKHKILKDFVTLWKSGENKEFYFKKILERIDKLIVYKVGKLTLQYAVLLNVESQDLYNTAILGVYRALDSVKDTDDGARIQARILSYIKEEIRKTYMQHRKEIVTNSLTGKEDNMASKEPEFTSLECDELKDTVNELIANFKMPKEDFEIFVEHTINNVSYKEIAKKLRIHYTTVANRIKKVKKLLKETIEGGTCKHAD